MKEALPPPALPFALEIKPSRVLYALFLCLVFVCGSIFMLVYGEQMDNPGFAHFISIIGIIFFGAAGVLLVVKFLQRRPVFTITKQGILEKPGVLITWPEISTVETCKFSRQRFVAVYLHDPEAYIAKYNCCKGNMTLIGTPMVLNGKLAGIDSDTLLTWLKFYLGQHGNAKN